MITFYFLQISEKNYYNTDLMVIRYLEQSITDLNCSDLGGNLLNVALRFEKKNKKTFKKKETANILSLMLQQTSSITFSELFCHVHSGTATNEYVTK